MLMDQLRESAEFVRSQSDLTPRVGLTLGSGLSAFAEAVKVSAAIPYNEIPHFVPPSVEGHPGQLVLGEVGHTPIAILQGRVHLYEGHSMQQVVYPTRLLKMLGIETLIVTNAAGGLDPNMSAGDFMVIQDHINLTGQNPLVGPNEAELGPRFPDMTDVYDKTLAEKLAAILSKNKVSHHQGVYCGMLGPTYETAAEVRYLQSIGGSAAGMSTVAEVIAARHMGLRVCGLSCISNQATGIAQHKITHQEVEEVTKKVADNFKTCLLEFIQEL